jgi:hypothetical protein
VPDISYPNIGGGRHGGLPPDAIKETELAELINYYTFGSKLVRRGGCRPITTAVAANDLYSFFPYYPSTLSGLTSRLLLGTSLGLGYLDGPGVTMLPPEVGLSPAAGTKPWVHFQYKDIAYAFQPGWGLLLRCDGSYYGLAGITAPITAPTLADGGVGVLGAADWYGVYTFYNPMTGVESNPSPLSVKLTLAANKKIAWSGIATSTQSQVTARRLYRVLPNQSNELYFVHQINDNVVTTYLTDNVLVQNMGSAASYSNGIPPNTLTCGAIWNERFFTSDGVYLYYSELGLVECFDPVLGVLMVDPDDGHTIKGIASLGDRLIIGKTNKMHFLLGTGPQSFARYTLSDRHGCYSQHSMATAEGILYWFGGDNFYSTDGSAVSPIGDSKIRDLMDKVPSAYYDKIVGACNPILSQYLAILPQQDPTTGAITYIVVVFNYRTASWSVYRYDSGLGSICYLGDYWTTAREKINYALFSNKLIYHHEDPSYNFDGGFPIVADWTSRAFKGKGPSTILRRVFLSADQYYGAVLDLYAYCNGVLAKTRTGLTLDTRDWEKVYNLSTAGLTADLVQVRCVYAGESPIEIGAMGFDVDEHARFSRQPI